MSVWHLHQPRDLQALEMRSHSLILYTRKLRLGGDDWLRSHTISQDLESQFFLPDEGSLHYIILSFPPSKSSSF